MHLLSAGPDSQELPVEEGSVQVPAEGQHVDCCHDFSRINLDNLGSLSTGAAIPEFDMDLTVHGSENGIQVKEASALSTKLDNPCFPQLFEQAAAKHPTKTAVICGDDAVTYTELSALATHLIRGLVHHGLRPGDIVGVAMHRSINLVAVLLAVTTSGAAYIPIDPTFPPDRIRQMTDDASPKLLVVDCDAAVSFAPIATVPAVTVTDLLQPGKAATPSPHPSAASEAPVQNTPSPEDRNPTTVPFPSPTLQVNSSVPAPDSLAYIIYTSGSTGLPKGVEITHSSLSNLLLSMLSTPGFSSSDTLLAVTTISFDMAVPELFVPLVSGGTVVVAKQDEVRDVAALCRLVMRWNVTVVQATPVLWGVLMEFLGPPKAGGVADESRFELSQIWCGGEALSSDLALRLLSHADAVWNLYGPTEVTVYAAMWKVREQELKIRVGHPVGGCMLYVVEPEDGALRQVEPGQVGELCVGGKGVAKGYRNRAKLTREKIVRNPWHGGFMYRTGDLARVDAATGEVIVLGRMDGQVKIRGFRIEAGDVEGAILRHDEVSGAVVVARDERLVAYCVRKRPAPMGQGKETPALADLLRPLLAQQLPAYMVPAFFVELDAFPTTLNGKIDRKALPDPVASLPSAVSALGIAELEASIVNIWSCVLGHDHIRTTDNFFEIGGDSLRIVRVQKKLESLVGRPVSVATLFEHYTIKTLAKHLSTPTYCSRPVPEKPPKTERGDIAIISMACRLPGGVSTPDELWALLSRGEDAITDVPPGRWEDWPFSTTAPYPPYGGFLPFIHCLDLSLFNIAPREARVLDPSHYLMLEAVHEAIERAGYTSSDLRGSQTGVYMGVCNIPAFYAPPNPTSSTSSRGDAPGEYAITGSAASTLSGRISHHFDLSGPTMTIDTACSSSLVATHLACTALENGECALAIVGGVTLMLNPGLQAEYARLGGTSLDGRCRSFSATSDGTGFSEGCVTVLLKRVSDAVRDGDAIHAVIRGSAVNHDGRSAGLTVPSGAAQARQVRTALAKARLAPADVDYVEAHGTGTRLGDPIEAAAVGEMFGADGETWREKTLWIGSVKSNIGHTQAAAGLAGLVKVVLAMEHGVLPATIHVNKPTEGMDWARMGMMPVMEKREWTAGRGKRRAGVSSFGIGWTNAHVVVEEGPSIQTGKEERMPRLPRVKKTLLPFLISGDTDAALHRQVENLRAHLTTDQGGQLDLEDVAYSLATTRNHYRKRLVVLAKDNTELMKRLSSHSSYATIATTPPEPPKLAMLFTGQGSQYPGMGKKLSDMYPVFDRTIREIAVEFDAGTSLDKPLLDVRWAAPGSDTASLLDRTDYAQAALFALEVALWRLWQSWGVVPKCLVGHSLGEVVVAHAAGILSLSDACQLVAARGRLMQAQSGDYRMASVEASGEEVAEVVERLEVGEVDIALYNTPTQTVISGATRAVESVRDLFARQDGKTKTLLVGHVFHSRYMDGMLAELRAVIETAKFHPPRIPIISSLDGRVNQGQMETADYWVRQVRQPVLYIEAVKTLVRCGITACIEICPSPVLNAMGAACLAHESTTMDWLPSLSRDRDGASTPLLSLSTLHTRRVDVDWKAYFAPFHRRRVPLPTYAFHRTFHQRVSKEAVRDSTESLTPLGQNTQAFEFKIFWVPTTKSMSTRGTWGVISPSGSAWAANLLATLTTPEIELVNIDSLSDTENLDRIICLWSESGDMMPQTQTLVSKALTQLQVAVQTQLKKPLVWITHHSIGTGDVSHDKGMIPGPGSLLWGLMRTARNEHPELLLRLVDLGPDVARRYLLSALSDDTEPECAVRQNQILFPRMGRLSAAPQVPAKPIIRSDGAFLITGGLGYLGAHMARWLTSKHGVRDLVLASRRGMETAGAHELVSELSAAGVMVTVVASDISDPDSVASLMAAFDNARPLRGIIHAAGVSDSGVLSSLTPERCQRTILPKARGAWLLHEATMAADLDCFAMFSSVSGVMGMPGLANYAAANCFLNSLAHLRHAQNLPATSIAYGTWAGDGGMAARLGGGARSHLSQFGLEPLLPDKALDALERAVVSRCPLTVAAGLDLGRLLRFYRDQRDTIPQLLQPLLLEDGGSTDPNSSRPSVRETLNKSPTAEHLDIMLGMVREVVATSLGFAHPQDVDADRPLRDIGIDSLTAVQIRNHLSSLTDLALSINIALHHPTLRALSAALLVQLHSQSSPPAPASDQLPIDAICKGTLDRAITFDSHAPPGRTRSVFLTGAAGFVGAFVLHALLQRGVTVHCLVRAPDEEKALQRILTTLESYSLAVSSSLIPLIISIPGDASQSRFGLTGQAFAQLSTEIDAICHCAGLIDWMRPLTEYIGLNIVSTHEVLRLASLPAPANASARRKTPVHLISTISTLPFHAGSPPARDSDPEHGYGTSKYVAERLVGSARWRGAEATIYRLPYVTASTQTGAFRRDKGDFLHNLVVGSLEIGSFPTFPGGGDMAIVLPVDYLADVVVGVMLGDDKGRAGKDWDFRNSRAVGCNAFFKMMAMMRSRLGKEIETVRIREWKRRTLGYAAGFPQSHLARISAVLDGYTEDTAASMFRGERVGRNVFGSEVRPAPRLDEEWARKYLERICYDLGYDIRPENA